VKIGGAVLVLDSYLAIDQGGFAGKPAAGIDHPPIGPCPVIAVPGKGSDPISVGDDDVSIKFRRIRHARR
jgi:hypothetical protein